MNSYTLQILPCLVNIVLDYSPLNNMSYNDLAHSNLSLNAINELINDLDEHDANATVQYAQSKCLVCKTINKYDIESFNIEMIQSNFRLISKKLTRLVNVISIFTNDFDASISMIDELDFMRTEQNIDMNHLLECLSITVSYSLNDLDCTQI